MSAPIKPPPWWESFDFLAPDVRADLGRLVGLLDRGLATTGAARIEEPAGWAGLSRRGAWERLVPSHWALLETAPEEFARRADQGELGFWESAQEAEESRRSVWVWLDAGPDQLGACRVVQIALLLWLQRLCRRTGGEFYWGVVQAPDTGYEQLGAEELRKFLALRSPEPPRLPPELMDGMDTWCVGSEGWIRGLPSAYHLVSLRQEGLRSVELRTSKRRLELPLPSEERAVRLLRDPTVWKVARRAAVEVRPASGPGDSGPIEDVVFSRCARKLLIVYEDRLVVAPLPASSRQQAGKLRVYPFRYPGAPLAVSMESRAIRTVQQQGDDWIFYRLNPGAADHGETLRVAGDDSDSPWVGTCWRSEDRWHVWIEDEYWTAAEGGLGAATPVLAGLPLGSSSQLLLSSGQLIDPGRGTPARLDPLPEGQLLLTRGGIHQIGKLGLVIARHVAEQGWKILWRDGEQSIPVQGEVVGFLCTDPKGPSLVVQEKERLRLQGVGWHQPLDLEVGFRFRFHPAGMMAYFEERGGLVCYNFHERAVVWRYSC